MTCGEFKNENQDKCDEDRQKGPNRVHPISYGCHLYSSN